MNKEREEWENISSKQKQAKMLGSLTFKPPTINWLLNRLFLFKSKESSSPYLHPVTTLACINRELSSGNTQHLCLWVLTHDANEDVKRNQLINHNHRGTLSKAKGLALQLCSGLPYHHSTLIKHHLKCFIITEKLCVEGQHSVI